MIKKQENKGLQPWRKTWKGNRRRYKKREQVVNVFGKEHQPVKPQNKQEQIQP
jgi:hypothetical protein